jgi:hypothetical protein
MDVTMGLVCRHFGSARLGDARRTKRLMNTAEQILRHPGGTLPQKLGDGWAELMGLYRLLSAPEVTHEAVLAPHRQQTLERMIEHDGVVLLVHDSTELDYTHCRSMQDQLGQIGTGGGWGYIAHHTLAVTPQGEVLGLVNQVLHHRRRVSKRETRSAKQAHPQRESRLWLAGCESSGRAPAGKLWIDIADRGSDTMEFLAYEHARGWHYVIRSARDRVLAGEDHLGDDRIHGHLHEYARDLPELGRRTIQVPARPGKSKARLARVGIGAAPVSLCPQRWMRGQISDAAANPLEMWVIHVAEIDAPGNVEPLEWILLSDLPANTLAQTAGLIDFYACRPVVEDYHKGQKTGLGIEQMQFEHADRLEPAIALLSVIAALLLQLRHAARDPGAEKTLARTLVPLILVQVLSARLFNQVRTDLTVREFLFGVARLGGHLGRKHDGPPGWLTLWRGWSDLQLMAQGATALRLGG